MRGGATAPFPHCAVRGRACVGDQAPSAHPARGSRRHRCTRAPSASLPLPPVGRVDDADVSAGCSLLPALLGEAAARRPHDREQGDPSLPRRAERDDGSTGAQPCTRPSVLALRSPSPTRRRGRRCLIEPALGTSRLRRVFLEAALHPHHPKGRERQPKPAAVPLRLDARAARAAAPRAGRRTRRTLMPVRTVLDSLTLSPRRSRTSPTTWRSTSFSAGSTRSRRIPASPGSCSPDTVRDR